MALTDFKLDISTVSDPAHTRIFGNEPSILLDRLPRYGFDALTKAHDRAHESALDKAKKSDVSVDTLENPYFQKEFYEILLGTRTDWILWRAKIYNSQKVTGLTLYYYSGTEVGEPDDDGFRPHKGSAVLDIRNPIDLGLKFTIPATDTDPRISYRVVMNYYPQISSRYLSIIESVGEPKTPKSSDRRRNGNEITLYTTSSRRS